ncbi:hypothetical protein Oter_0640 [Opitutus terrae PB90-1]|uniref:Uncharacterized protein n=2 Tax=Opitutus terrae TaxID=107709 RepID=B1ZTI5_OPITP|nr:hypothetical protein Oter_0640 [Opitutus terrae PB90-1]
MLIAAVIGLAVVARVHAAAAADISTSEKRRPSLELAERLAQPPNLAPLPGELVHPFNPAAFGQPDPEELRAIAAAQAAAQAAQTATKPTTDREFLQVIAARIMPSGTVIIGDEPWLIFGKKRLRVGDRLTVAYDGQDYQLELAGIDRTNFTLRLNRDEITRPIKPRKTP